jgi:hypothetical protein
MRLDRDRIIFIALIVLDEVCDQCQHAIVRPSFSIRLALATLYALGRGERRHYEDFWREMRSTTYPGANPSQIDYMRGTLTRTAFTGIATSVGVSLSLDYCERMQKARGKKDLYPRVPSKWQYDERQQVEDQPEPGNDGF